MKVAGELERRIKPRFEFDVKILNSAPIEFQFEVIKKGRVIFSRDKARRIDYEFEVISLTNWSLMRKQSFARRIDY